MSFSWSQLPRPFFVLAPMEGATDTVFRQIISSCAPPDVYFTEFTNTDGMLSKGYEKVEQRLLYTKIEHPLIAQIWGTDPESFEKAARKIVQLGFDGIDINMGCPEKSIVKRGSCSGLIRTPELAKDIIDATKRGASNLPVSVKTRLGFSSIQMEWIEFLLKQNLPALTIHLRTRKEMSKVEAHWELLDEIVTMKNTLSSNTVLIANGDIENKFEGKKLAEKYNVDGIMIGRGIFHNPFAFGDIQQFNNLSMDDRINLLVKHIDLFDKTWKGEKSYNPLKRYFKIYISGFEGAGDIRERLMETTNTHDAKEILARTK